MSRMPGRDDTTADSSRLKLTYDDFVLFPDDGQRHELIDGEHFVTPSPNTKHQTISMNLVAVLSMWLEAHPVGRLFHAPYDVVFSNFDVVEPDLLYLSNERMASVITPQHVRGAPNLVIEIGSPGTRRRDETIKRRLYERFGVDEYWVVDPELDRVRIHRREAGATEAGFGRPVEFSREAGDVVTTPLLPDLRISLERIFRE
jgi:Uma2 family endonuclease